MYGSQSSHLETTSQPVVASKKPAGDNVTQEVIVRRH